MPSMDGEWSDWLSNLYFYVAPTDGWKLGWSLLITFTAFILLLAVLTIRDVILHDRSDNGGHKWH